MYQELENKVLSEFDNKFVRFGLYYRDEVKPDRLMVIEKEVIDFLKSHLKEAYEAGVDKTIERFATGELLKSDDAQKFYDLAYEAGKEEGGNNLGNWAWKNCGGEEEKIRQQAIAEERERIIKWAEKYMDKTTKYYGTDKHGINPDDLIQELTK